MEVSKITNIASVGFLTLIITYFSFSSLFEWVTRRLALNYFNFSNLFGILICFAIATLLVIYLIFLIRAKIDYKSWVKVSMILNLIGIISFILFWCWMKIKYLNCMATYGSKCLLGFGFSISAGLIWASFFFIIGFILLIIGIVKNKKGKVTSV